MFNLKDIIKGQEVVKAKSYNTDLFKSDSENITEDFSIESYEKLILIDTESNENSLKETIIGLHKGEAFLINANTVSYNGESQTNISQKWLTLAGFNYFTKDFYLFTDNEFIDSEGHLTADLQDFYTDVLKSHKYDITYNDVLEFGVYNSEYKVTILNFEDEEQNKHFITINEKGQLSKITKKISPKNVGTSDRKNGIKKEKIKSILG